MISVAVSCSCDSAVPPSRAAHGSRRGWSRPVAGRSHCCSGSAGHSCGFAGLPGRAVRGNH
ncbi:hypothetical protein ABTH15_19430, partial [Acinetobacter baumannii]